VARSAAAKKVIGLGLSVVDQLILWQDMSRPVLGNRILACETQGGGMVGTALVAVSRLGGAAEFWGAVGSDWMGEWIVAGLAAEGVDTSQVVRVPGGRGPFVLVCVDQPTGERHFPHYTGRLEPDGPIGSLERLSGTGCVLIDATQPESQLRLAAEARRLGVPVVGDFSRIGQTTAALLKHVDYAIFSEGALGDLDPGADPRAACEKLRSMGPRCAVITRGAKGLAYHDGETYGEMPAFDVDVVDTTGAGDVLHGAFCYGLVQGFDLERNLRFASATAAVKCTRLGGRAGIPNRQEVERFLQEHQGAV